MNNEFLKMQKLAGLITESEYKAKIEEEDVMGKIGKSYPALKKDVLSQPNLGLSPEQYKKIQKEIKKEYKKEFDEDEANYLFNYMYYEIFFGEDFQNENEDDLLKLIGVDTPEKQRIFIDKKWDLFYDMMG
jgi:uncharacterized protein YpuA (DUF1002 family)